MLSSISAGGAQRTLAPAITENSSARFLPERAFSLCRFHQFTVLAGKLRWRGGDSKHSGSWICIVWRCASRWSASIMPLNDPPDVDTAALAEASNRAAFVADPYDCWGRCPASGPPGSFRRCHGYRDSCPDLRPLLDHRGPELFSGPLPWDTL
jgi:hypothetical protein